MTRPWNNVIFRTGAEGSARVLNFLLAVLGARFLGVEGWGLYWSAFSFAQALILLTDLGGHLTLSRSVTRTPARARMALGTSLALKLVLSVASAAIWSFAGGFPGVIPFPLQAVLVGAALFISFVEWLGFHLRGFGRVRAESVLLAVDCVAAFTAGTASLLRGASPLAFAITQFIAHGTVLGLAFVLFGREKVFRPVIPNPRSTLKFLRESLPTGIAQLASLGSWRLGVMVLAVLPGAGPVSAGLFSAAHRVLEAARFFPSAAAAALFPSFALRNPEERPGRALMFLLPPALIMALGLTHPAVSTPLMRLLYGAGYSGASFLMGIIWWAFPFMTINWVLSHWLIARGREKTNAVLSVIQLAVHASALLLLVPTLGTAGAGWALVIAEGTLSTGLLLSLLLF